MEIGDIWFCHYGLKHTVIAKIEDLGEVFVISRFKNFKGWNERKIEMERFFEGDFKNNRKFKSKYLYNKCKRNYESN